jgi:hypothetical protein
MGDLVRLEEELNPVMAKVRPSGFEITAAHDHLMGRALPSSHRAPLEGPYAREVAIRCNHK